MTAPTNQSAAQLPGGPAEQLTRLQAEVEALRDEGVRRAANARWRAHFWTVAQVLLGFPAAVLAAASGATGLAAEDSKVLAAVLAFGSAGCAAGIGFLHSDARARANRRVRRAWTIVDYESRLLLMQLPTLEPAAAHDALRSIFEQRQRALCAYGEDVESADPRSASER